MRSDCIRWGLLLRILLPIVVPPLLLCAAILRIVTPRLVEFANHHVIWERAILAVVGTVFIFGVQLAWTVVIWQWSKRCYERAVASGMAKTVPGFHEGQAVTFVKPETPWKFFVRWYSRLI